MFRYIIQRLILLPITLFFILLVNFVIINLAPGDPVQMLRISPEGMRQDDHSVAFGSDDQYLQFRERYGLTLPIILNTWPWITADEVHQLLAQLVTRKETPNSTTELSVKDYESLRTAFGDRARFIMPLLMAVIDNPQESFEMRRMAIRFFVRGGTRQAVLGPNLSAQEKQSNRQIAKDNQLLRSFLLDPRSTESAANAELTAKSKQVKEWYVAHESTDSFEPTTREKIGMLFFQTRFFRYMSRIMTLDFGTLRNDNNKTVISEVTRRFKYSLTLSILPMMMTFVCCQIFGFCMALYQNRAPDYFLNLVFLSLYAIPIFVVAPFLIEKIALNHYFPFTHIPIPISGFTSPDSIYMWQTTKQRLFDVIQHIFLPLVAIMYGGMAAQSRMSRTAILEVMHQDYIRTARAKGVPPATLYVKHVGRNAAITIVTSIASSLGIVLGGSLIVETLFEINGFGKFFYDAIINRDYNVILFSTLASSFLTLIGYLVADLTYTFLDPRLTLYQVSE